MEARYADLLAAAAEAQECLEDVQPLGALLPEDAQELEALLDWLGENDRLHKFGLLLHAALIAGRKPDVDVARRHAGALRNERWLAGIALKLGGDVPGYLLWVSSQDVRYPPSVRALALVLAMNYQSTGDPRVSRERLVEGYQALLPCLRVHPKIPGAVQEVTIIHVCALSLALGQPLPRDHFRVSVKGKKRGYGRNRIAAEDMEFKANKCLVEFINLSRYPASRLLPPTRADITPDEAPSAPHKRKTPKILPNMKCPCGSGKKYKKCCSGGDREMATAQKQQKGIAPGCERLLTEKDVKSAEVLELARLDFKAIDKDLYPAFARRFLGKGAFRAALSLFKVAGTDGPMAESYLFALKRTTRLNQLEHLADLAGLIPEERLHEMHDCLHTKLALISAEPAGQGEVIERELTRSIDNPLDLADLAVNLMQWKMPGLGIVAARAALAAGVPPRHAGALRIIMEQTRPGLGLEAIDPATPLVQRIIDGEEEESEMARAVAELDREVARAASRARKQEEAIKTQENDISTLRAAADEARQEATADAGHGEQATKLKGRLEMMTARLNALQAERRGLRQELTTAQDKLAAQEAELRAAETEDAAVGTEEDLLGATVIGPQPVRIPVFPKRFLARLERFPAGIRRAAMSLVGEMAAGYEHAWVGTRKLELRPDILRQKVKRNYRIFLKESSETLEVIDMVDRKDFERAVDGL